MMPDSLLVEEDVGLGRVLGLIAILKWQNLRVIALVPLGILTLHHTIVVTFTT